ncbi:hypothetical protein JKP88DRAFT_348513 [Tribonema minus]|uniref:Solute carrier family 66 member 3 n=1 Tax=Tribonema minus TaxID=303371 RepID=A0A836CGJ2_9STRA|nr:hypothetical protein JKP88DRAFT_348513 [Tribonema minus]
MLRNVYRYSGGASGDAAAGDVKDVVAGGLYSFLQLPPSATAAETARVIFAKLAGLGIIVGSMGMKLPQIMRILEARSVLGLSLTANYFEVPLVSNGVIYHFKKGYPFSAYGENAFLLVQNLIVVALMWRYSAPPMKHRAMAAMTATFVALCVGTYSLPDRWQPLLVLSSTPLILLVTIPQILVNARQGHTGQMSAITVALKLGGSAIRLATTLIEIGVDRALLLNYGLGTVLNGVLMAQWYLMRDATQAAIEFKGEHSE